MGIYLRLSSVWVPATGSAGGLLLAGACGDKHPMRSQQGGTWDRALCQAKAVAEPVPGSLSPWGAEAPNPPPKGL